MREPGSTIVVHRPRGWFARWRRLDVRIDGEIVARLRMGETATLPVSEGPHVLSVAMDWCSSAPHLVICRGGGEHAFRAKMPRFGAVRRKVFFQPDSAFALEPIDGAPGTP